MNINPLNQIQASGLEKTSKKAISPKTLSEEDFYTLLITQLQNQDPLNPMDSQQMLSQISQLTQLNAIKNMEKHIEDMTKYQLSVNNLAALSLLGKEVAAQGNTIHLIEGSNANIQFSLNSDAQDVVLSIYDTNGNQIRTLDIGKQSAGVHTITWDGRDNSGNFVPSGSYKFDVAAVDPNGNPVETSTYMTGKVTEADFDNNTLYLYLQGYNQPVSLDQIVKIKDINNTQNNNQGGV